MNSSDDQSATWRTTVGATLLPPPCMINLTFAAIAGYLLAIVDDVLVLSGAADGDYLNVGGAMVL